ncbi:MAG: TlyA family RNA methyltransferase, partial [Candidatus Aminicenantes bacterium]
PWTPRKNFLLGKDKDLLFMDVYYKLVCLYYEKQIEAIMKNKQTKNRLDEAVVKLGLASSKEKASTLIMAGEILVDHQVVYQADKIVTGENRIELKEKFPYVSRGALKIEKALKDFSIDINGLKVLDIGISTGGFADYMLKNNADRVTGVDVNIQQVDYGLRKHPRIKLIKANARHARELTPDKIGFIPDLITIDVSFISVTKILPALTQYQKAKVVALLKPQFEAKREKVDKGGVIREKEKRAAVLLDLKQRIMDLNFRVKDFTSAGVKGRKGNREYFFLLEYGKKASINDKIITHGIETEL